MKGDWREGGRTDACNAATTEGTAQKVSLAVRRGQLKPACKGEREKE